MENIQIIYNMMEFARKNKIKTGLKVINIKLTPATYLGAAVR